MSITSSVKILVLNALLIFAAPVLVAQTPVYEDIYWHDQPDQLVLGNRFWHVSIDKKSGQWLALTPKATGQNLINSVPGGPRNSLDVRIDGKFLVDKTSPSVVRYAVSTDRFRRGTTLDVVLTVSPDYELTCRYTLQPNQLRLQRSARLHRRAGSGAAVKFERFDFSLPAVLLGQAKDCVFDVPGPFFPKTLVVPETPYDSLLNRTIGFHSAPDAGFGVLALTNRQTAQTLATWMNTSGETNYRPFVVGDGKQISLRHENYRYHRLLPGQTIESDVQEIVLTAGLPEALNQYRQGIDATMPMDQNTPAWVKEAVILEIYPEYFKEGFKGITKKLAFYREIGFNVIYLMPHWKGGYSPIDLFAVEPKFGTEDDLRTLTRTAHQLGMKVIFDMVIHGFNKKSDVPKQRPELFVKREDDSLALHPTWKSITTDWAAPAYQKYMVDVVKYDLKTYDIDGYRVDAASYKGPGWNAALPYPAYRPGAAAPELMRAMLDALRTDKPDAMLLSEVFGPAFYSVSNLAHDNQTEACTLLLERLADGRYSAEQYKKYLAAVYDMLPAGANRVFFARNHDTSWFFHFNGYSPLFLAFDSIHALVGIPEFFAGDPKHPFNPDDQPETYAFYKKLYKFRRERPELIQGEIVLRDVQSDNPMVFSAVRRLPGRSSLILVSLSGKEETVATALKGQTLPAQVEFLDPISGQRVRANPGKMKLKPFQVLIGALK